MSGTYAIPFCYHVATDNQTTAWNAFYLFICYQDIKNRCSDKEDVTMRSHRLFMWRKNTMLEELICIYRRL